MNIGVRRKTKNKRGGWSWWATGAVFGCVGAVIFPMFGAVILQAAERGATFSPFVLKFALVLSVLTIPLLILGLYCLNIAVERATPKRDYYGSRRQLMNRTQKKIKSEQRLEMQEVTVSKIKPENNLLSHFWDTETLTERGNQNLRFYRKGF